MRVVLAFATANAVMRNYLAAKRDAVVPPDVNKRGYWHEKNARFSIQIQAVSHATTPGQLGQWLRRASKDAAAVVLFIDGEFRHLAADLEDAYFIVPLTGYTGNVMQNQMFSILAPVLRQFAIYCSRFDSLRNQRLLLLPLDIFLAPELAALRTRLTTDKMETQLGEKLDGLLSELNTRAGPKTKQRFRTVYIVDDRPLFYHYGPDRHAVVPTGMPPHAEKCWHNSCFRFGRFYDDRLHHNVDDNSAPTKVLGQFVTCHGDSFQANGQSHLNVFPNGYI